MKAAVVDSPLFLEMTADDIEKCLCCANAQIRQYEKQALIFTQLDNPAYLYVLLRGAVAVCRDSLSGKRSIVAAFEQSGDIFGEVYVFLAKQQYDYYTLATKKTTVLAIPKAFFYHQCAAGCDHHARLIRNMLAILAQKAYYLNQKLQLLSSGSLRQKLAKYLLENMAENQTVAMHMNRREFADFLHVARPSLSRELMKMIEQGLIESNGKNIRIVQPEQLEQFL